MQVLITHSSLARTRALSFSRWQMLGALFAVALVFLLASGTIYHFIFLKAARDGWPIVSQIVRLVVRDEIAQRDRFMRENLDAIAQKVGDMQAKLVKLEAMGERVVGLAGVKAEELKPLKRTSSSAQGGAGGPYLPLQRPSLTELQATIENLGLAVDQNTDVFTLMESRLLESRLQALLVPSSAPVAVSVGSGFGFRPDPFTGHASLHTGLDFPAEVGTPITAAAGGIVTMREWHAAYGNTLEIDHGNGLVTRYAHTSAFEVERGALVKRGQLVARVGNTGRSTGPHLHFEVLVDGAPQDPARFLAGGSNPMQGKEFARRPGMPASAAPGAAVQVAATPGPSALPRPPGVAPASAPAPASLAPPRPSASAQNPTQTALPAATTGAPPATPARPVIAPAQTSPLPAAGPTTSARDPALGG
ncbi:MAG: peptidoglycan DD-metalloendopeptidase family protein [Rubrivivax sp.]|nr:peptidoglycan DD-metalloendopeptidase family protein [Rubrivivax sp.]